MKHATLSATLICTLLAASTGLAAPIVFTDAADSYIVWTSGILTHNDNHGSAPEIQTANNGIWDTYGLISFNGIFGTGANQVSTSTTIASAELHLWMSRESAAFPNRINLYQLTAPWEENTVTGSNYSGMLANTTGVAVDTYYKAAADGASLPQELIFDVTASLLDWQSVGGVTNFGWGIESVTLHAVNYFYSSESGGDYTPFLVVNAEGGGIASPTTLLLLGIGIAGLAVSRR